VGACKGRENGKELGQCPGQNKKQSTFESFQRLSGLVSELSIFFLLLFAAGERHVCLPLFVVDIVNLFKCMLRNASCNPRS